MEVASGEGRILIRDTTDRDGAILTLPPASRPGLAFGEEALLTAE